MIYNALPRIYLAALSHPVSFVSKCLTKKIFRIFIRKLFSPTHRVQYHDQVNVMHDDDEDLLNGFGLFCGGNHSVSVVNHIN